MPHNDLISIDDARVRAAMPERSESAHKWGGGGVIVVAGSPTYPGAAILASRAAGRAGAGIVLLATSRGVIGVTAAAIPEVAHIPLPETESASGARKALELIEEQCERAHAVVIGPGLTTDNASQGLLGALLGIGVKSLPTVRTIGFGTPAPASESRDDTPATGLLAHEDVKLVIDADGLNWLATQEEWWRALPPQRLILTPHPGELSRLLDRPVDEITAEPAGITREAAAKWNQVVVLKGGHAVVSDGTTTLIADTASPALATAGSGDVLAGTIGAFLAQTGSPLDAAIIALHAGPRAADRVAERFGVAGVIATDLPDAIAEVLRDLQRVG
jgi:NAD(P)H-hydrate epimerase